MKQPLRLLMVILLGLACGWLAGCQAGSGSRGRAEPPAATRTPFQPSAPTANPGINETQSPEEAQSAAQSGAEPDLPAVADGCGETAGRIEEKEVAFPPDEAVFHFRVYLPPCFDRGDGAPYPVLYMLHGQTFFDDQWQRLGIGEAADELIAEGDAPPFLIVMPREPDTFADIYQSSFRSNVIDGLIPWIDETYPTCTKRACRAIGGLSRGGAWALHLGFTHWELFGAIGAHSTPPFNNTPRLFPTWVEQIPSGSLPRVYMDIGRRDPYLSQASAFETQLVEHGVPHEWYLFNGTHDEEYWSSHVADYLRWYASAWERP